MDNVQIIQSTRPSTYKPTELSTQKPEITSTEETDRSTPSINNGETDKIDCENNDKFVPSKNCNSVNNSIHFCHINLFSLLKKF